MNTLNAVLNRLFDIGIAPFRGQSPWPAMIAACLATTVLVLLIFKYTSNQKTLRSKKNRAIARLLEFVLFKDDIVVSIGALGRVIAANCVYLCALLVPLVVCVIPVFLILVQLSCWIGVRPLKAGETTVLTATLRGDLPVMKQSIGIGTSPGLTVNAGPIRVPSKNEVSWRLSVKADGFQWVDLSLDGGVIRKTVTAGTRPGRVSPLRPAAGAWKALTNPSEAPLPPASPIVSVRVDYPAANLELGHLACNWLLVFFVLTLVFGIVLLRPLRVVV